MSYPQHVIEEIREINDIVDIISQYVNLNKRGASYIGLCPFHNENTPSFSVSQSKQIYRCFGCGVGGNAYSFVMAIEGCDFLSAVEHLATKANYILPKKNNYIQSQNNEKDILYTINTEAAKFFYENLKDSQKAINYIKNRGLSPKIAKKFGLGYSLNGWDNLLKHLSSKGYSLLHIEKAGLITQSNSKHYDRFRDRLMFPIFDVRGKIIAFGGRSFANEMPKYINSPETLLYNKSETFYALNFAKKHIEKEIIVVEGYMDAIALYQAGFYNVIASLGTSFTAYHSKLITRFAKSVAFIFDSDNAGKAAAIRAINTLKNSGLIIKIVTLQGAKDPDEYIKKFSVKDLAQEIHNAKNYIDFQIDNLLNTYDMQNTQSKIEFTKQACEVIVHLKDSIEQDVYINKISHIANVSYSSIKSQLGDKPNIVPIKKPRPIKIGDRAIKEAQENILCTLLNSYAVYTAVFPYLSPQEMGNDTYKKLLQLIYDLYEHSNHIVLANVLNYFHDDNEQQTITNILSNEPNTDKFYLTKALTDQVKLIKKNCINNQIAQEKDIKAIENLINKRKNLENLNITLLDG